VNWVRSIVSNSSNPTIIQTLYSYTGIDPRCIELVKFPLVNANNAEIAKYDMSAEYKVGSAEYAACKAEYKQILDDRKFFRDMQFNLQSFNPIARFTDTYYLALNIGNIIDDVVGEYTTMKSNSKNNNPKIMYDRVVQLLEDLPYIYYNVHCKKIKMPVPQFVKDSMTFNNILIRSYLNNYTFKIRDIDIVKLNIICDRIENKLRISLVQYGLALGILAAQAIAEPLTQFLLDSKHRSATSGSKTDTLIRIKEILGAVPTDKMFSPSMTIKVLPKYETNKLQVIEFANKIKLIKFKQLISGYVIFNELFGKPRATAYKHEEKMIKEFTQMSPNKLPNDLIEYCIRYTININEMISKSFSLQDILIKMKKVYPYLYIVHSPEITDADIILRCYIRGSAFKSVTKTKTKQIIDKIIEMNETILETNIRGIDNILNTDVKEISVSTEDENGGISIKKIYHILTDGTNMRDVLKLPYVDKLRTQSDSILEIEEFYGIEAAKDKIVAELRTSYDKYSLPHCLFYGCVMTESGYVTNIKYTGINIRDPNNILLRMCLYSPNKALVHGAVNNITTPVDGISPPLLCGNVPKIATTYFDVEIDEEFNRENSKQLLSAIDEI
jgi:DNA-directed RNA polymerase II subunit RPB1